MLRLIGQQYRFQTQLDGYFLRPAVSTKIAEQLERAVVTDASFRAMMAEQAGGKDKLGPRPSLSPRGNILLAKNAHPAALAREFGRASLSDRAQMIALQGFRWTAAASGLLAWTGLFTTNRRSGKQCAAVAALVALPLVLAEARAATYGFRWLRWAGLHAIPVLRVAGAMPNSLALLAAPIIAHAFKQHCGGYSSGDQAAGEAD